MLYAVAAFRLGAVAAGGDDVESGADYDAVADGGDGDYDDGDGDYGCGDDDFGGDGAYLHCLVLLSGV